MVFEGLALMELTDGIVGDLLVSMGALSASDMSEARQIARSLNKPVIKVLVQSGFMSQEELNKALDKAYRKQEQLPAPPPVIRPPKIQRVPMPVQQMPTAAQFERIAVPEEQRETSTQLPTIKPLPDRAPSTPPPAIQPEERDPRGENFREFLAARGIPALLAQEIIRNVLARNISVEQAMAEVGLLSTDPQTHIKLGELLRLAGFVNQNDMERALKLSHMNGALIGKILVVCKLVSPQTVTNALQCQFLIRDGLLQVEEAVRTLDYCSRCCTTVDDAIAYLQECA
jgi:hypothetical protein